MNNPPIEWPRLPADQTPRCLSCAYVLTGLEDCRCPECGREFHPRNPKTYTTKPPFLAWKFWLPGFALGAVGGMIGAVLLLGAGNWGWSLWFAVPFAAGSLLGYRFRSKWWVLGMVMLALAVSLCTGAMVLDIAGIFCGLVLAGLFIGPIFAGTVLGAILRIVLKTTRFSQRWHLPAFLLFLIPLACGVIEGRPTKHAPERVSTSMIIDASARQSWDAIMFYEDVTHAPPFILRIGLARPLHTTGSSSNVDDVKTCVYNKGRITKRTTQVEPPRLLAFEVIEQHIGYERDVVLRGGSFAFQPLDSHRTRVTLTTEYEPLLTPRWAWRQFEVFAMRTLHEHVIDGMKLRAEGHAPRGAFAAGGPHAN